tara:strand:- start:82 stop:1182 length:1101 start_codon:yes stop_codon:yes gene_type:complete
MEKKLKYITYQTFPAKTANSIQTISTLKHINRLGISTVLIYPLRNQDSSDNLDQIRREYDFHDEIQLIGTIHPLPFKKIKILEKYWYLISHFLWSFFTVQKYYVSQDELYLTRSEWVFYFLSKKNAKVIYECHQITKLKKVLVSAGLKSENSKVIALTDDIKKELQPHNQDKVGVIASGYDDDFFFNQSEKKNHIVFAGSLYRFGESRGLEIIFENKLNLEMNDLKIIIISSDEIEIKSVEEKIINSNTNVEYQILQKLNQRQVGEILSTAKVGLLINNTSRHADLYTSPLKYFEYLASGLNVVATDLNSHRNLPLSDEIDFYQPNDVNSFYLALKNALNKKNQIPLTIRDYSIEKRVNKILNFYN